MEHKTTRPGWIAHLTLTYAKCIHCFNQGKRTGIILRPTHYPNGKRRLVYDGSGMAQIVGAHLRKVHPEVWEREQQRLPRRPGTGAAAV
jgi:hypothetical protein